MNLPDELICMICEKYFLKGYQGLTLYELPQHVTLNFVKLDCWELLKWDEFNIKLAVQWGTAVDWLQEHNPIFRKVFTPIDPITVSTNLKNNRILIKQRSNP